MHTFAVKLIGGVQKVALKRSHFLDPASIAGLFRSEDACVSTTPDGATAWIVADNRKE